MSSPSLGAFESWDDRLAFERESGRREAEAAATKVVALIVEAAGGSVFVPDRLMIGPDIYVADEPLNNGRRYFTRSPR